MSLRDILAGLNALLDNDCKLRRLAGPMMAAPLPIEHPRKHGAAHS